MESEADSSLGGRSGLEQSIGIEEAIPGQPTSLKRTTIITGITGHRTARAPNLPPLRSFETAIFVFATKTCTVN